MLKKLMCLLWGHIFTAKAATGNTVVVHNFITGEKGPVGLYKWEPLPFCPRCSKPNPYYDSLKKKSAEWAAFHTDKSKARLREDTFEHDFFE